MAFLRVSLNWALSHGRGEQAGHCVCAGIWKHSLCLGVGWENCAPLQVALGRWRSLSGPVWSGVEFWKMGEEKKSVTHESPQHIACYREMAIPGKEKSWGVEGTARNA